jgi:hypothetical protein
MHLYWFPLWIFLSVHRKTKVCNFKSFQRQRYHPSLKNNFKMLGWDQETQRRGALMLQRKQKCSEEWTWFSVGSKGLQKRVNVFCHMLQSQAKTSRCNQCYSTNLILTLVVKAGFHTELCIQLGAWCTLLCSSARIVRFLVIDIPVRMA